MNQSEHKTSSGKIIFFIVIILIACMGYCNRSKTASNETYESTDKADTSILPTIAFMKSQLFVKEQLKAPHTAEFPGIDENSITDLGDHTYIINSYVDAQNSFGASIRNRYRVKLRYTGGDPINQYSWQLMDIRLYDEN